jgi:hypothetical protein
LLAAGAETRAVVRFREEATLRASVFFRVGAAFRAVVFLRAVVFFRAVDFRAAAPLPRAAVRDFFAAALRVERAFRAGPFRRAGAAFRADPRDAFRALGFFRAAGREAFRPPVFFVFFATSTLLSTGFRREAGSYNSGFVQARRETRRMRLSRPGTGAEARVVMTVRPGGLSIEIRPLAGWRRWRRRLTVAALVVVAAALFGAARLVPLWETSLKRGNFSELPFSLLVFLTLAVGISTPLTLVGLAALAFSEETVEVDAHEVVIATTTFERTRVLRIPLAELDCWRETSVPLPPWWSWSVKRLAARSNGRLHPLAGGAGPREKRAIGLALARATGRALIGDFGRVIGGD